MVAGTIPKVPSQVRNILQGAFTSSLSKGALKIRTYLFPLPDHTHPYPSGEVGKGGGEEKGKKKRQSSRSPFQTLQSMVCNIFQTPSSSACTGARLLVFPLPSKKKRKKNKEVKHLASSRLPPASSHPAAAHPTFHFKNNPLWGGGINKHRPPHTYTLLCEATEMLKQTKLPTRCGVRGGMEKW